MNVMKMDSGIPKVFRDAFRNPPRSPGEDKPVIYVIGDPTRNYGCPDKIEINTDGSKTYIFGDA